MDTTDTLADPMLVAKLYERIAELKTEATTLLEERDIAEARITIADDALLDIYRKSTDDVAVNIAMDARERVSKYRAIGKPLK
jgi:hypothetical protein